MSKETREAYIERLETKLKEWSAEIDKLKAKAERSEVKIKEEYHKRIEDLRARRDDIKKRIQKLKEAGEAFLTDVWPSAASHNSILLSPFTTLTNSCL
jgi:chromosome segregation ATPase